MSNSAPNQIRLKRKYYECVFLLFCFANIRLKYSGFDMLKLSNGLYVMIYSNRSLKKTMISSKLTAYCVCVSVYVWVQSFLFLVFK